MLSSLKKINIIIIFGMFCLLYYPPLLSSINVMHIVGLFSICYLLLNRGYTGLVFSNTRWVSLYAAFGFMFVYIVFVAFFNSQAISAAVSPVYFLIDVLPFTLMLTIHGKKRNISVDDYINVCVFVSLIQAILALMAFFVPDVQHYFVNKLVSYGYASVYSQLSAYRMYGYSAGLTYATPVLQSIIALLLIQRDSDNKITDYILSIIIVFSAIINARTSLVIFGIGLIVIILYRGDKTGRKLVIIGSVLALLLVFTKVIMPYLEDNAASTYKWIFQGVDQITAFFNRTSESDSYFAYATNEDKYRFPDSFLGTLFGTGHIVMGGRSLYGYSSDVGYTNDVWLGGLVYIVFTYTFYIRKMLFLRHSQNDTLKYLGTLLLCIFPVLNIKGIFCTMSDFTNFMFVIVGIVTAYGIYDCYWELNDGDE